MRLNSVIKLRFLFLFAGFLILAGCGSASTPDAATMLQNLSSSYPALWKLVTATAFILGLYLVLKAVYTLKIYGESRTMTSSQSSIKTPIMYIVAGTMLVYVSTAFQIVNVTFFGTPNILQYTGAGSGNWTAASSAALIGLVQFIGLLSFVRGWLYIARAGDHSVQPGTMAKGFTHIIGGVLAINILQAKEIVWNTFGFG